MTTKQSILRTSPEDSRTVAVAFLCDRWGEREAQHPELTPTQQAAFDALRSAMWGEEYFIAQVGDDTVLLMDYEIGESDDRAYSDEQREQMCELQYKAIFATLPKLSAQFPQAGIEFCLAPPEWCYMERPSLWALFKLGTANQALSQQVWEATSSLYSQTYAELFLQQPTQA